MHAASEDPAEASPLKTWSLDVERRPLLAWALAFGVCVLLSLAAFGRSLDAGFLNFDDDRTLLHPRSVALDGTGAVPAFDGDVVGTVGRLLDPDRAVAEVWAPATQLSLYLDWWISGKRLTYAGRTFRRPTPFWPHLHNLLLHALCGSILALLLCELGLSLPLALLAALPFLLHPVQAEVVAWVSSRKDLCATLFSLLALRRGCRVVAGAASAWPVWVWTALALASKGSALVLPLIAPLLWLWPGAERHGPDGRRARFLLCWLPMLGLCGLAFLQQARLAQAFGTAVAGDPAVVPGTLLHYLRILVWPSGLAVHHPLSLREVFAADALAKSFWLALPLVAAVLCLVRGSRPLRLIGAGMLVVLLALAPFNGWIPATSIAAADRYLYLPSIGLALVLAGGLGLLSAPRVPLVAVAGGATLALVLGLFADARTSRFASSELLWQANLEVHPGDAVALYNLADVHLARADEIQEGRQAEIDRGLALLAEAAPLALRPEHRVRVHEARYLWLTRIGRLDEALEAARARLEAVRTLPDAGGRLALAAGVDLVELGLLADRKDLAGELLTELGDRHGDAAAILALRAWLACERGDVGGRDEARRLLNEAEPRVTATERALVLLGQARLAHDEGQGLDAARALEQLEHLIEVDPRHLFVVQEAALLRARMYEAAGQDQAAIQTLVDGLRRHPTSVPMRLALAARLEEVGDFASMERILRVVRELRPGADADRRLAKALVARISGLVDRESAKDYAPLVAEIEALAPDLSELAWFRGRILWDRKSFDEALVELRRAADALPGHPQVQRDFLELLRANGYRELFQAMPGGADEGAVGEAGRLEAERDRDLHEGRALALFREFLDRCPDSLAEAQEAVLQVVRRKFEERAEAGRAALFSDRNKDAVRLFEKALELWPEEAATRFNCGLAWFAQGVQDPEAYVQALAQFRRAHADAEAQGTDPGRMVLYEARCLAATGETEAARTLLRSYVHGEGRTLVKDERYRKQMQDELVRLSR